MESGSQRIVEKVTRRTAYAEIRLKYFLRPDIGVCGGLGSPRVGERSSARSFTPDLGSKIVSVVFSCHTQTSTKPVLEYALFSL